MKNLKRWAPRFPMILRLSLLSILVGAGFAAPYLLQREGFFRISGVSVNLREGASAPVWLGKEWSELLQEAKKLEGRDLWSLDLDQVAAQLKKREWIREVSLTRSWPSELRLSIESKNLVALARGKKGLLMPVLEDGRHLEPDQLSAFVSLPVLSGELETSKPEKIQEALELLRLFGEEGVLSRDRISELGYHSKEGYWILVMPFATKVRWGFGDFEKKISRVKQVMEYLDSRQIGARVIDADLSKKVVVRMRKTQ